MLKRAPQVEFWVQNIAMPGFYIPDTAQPTPFVRIPKSGDHVEYETLGITMLMDEELSNYMEIYVWLRELGFPEKFEEYRKLLESAPILDEGVTSEIVVMLLNGQQQPRWQFVFHDAFPIALSGFEMQSTDEGLQRVVCHAEFRYSYFDISRLS